MLLNLLYHFLINQGSSGSCIFLCNTLHSELFLFFGPLNYIVFTAY